MKILISVTCTVFRSRSVSRKSTSVTVNRSARKVSKLIALLTVS